tara:strand:- start:109 stop:435 length:327 start_codon:yes stop_codon:yes gene_type:complete
MVSIDLIKRFTSIEFGQQYSDQELFDKLKECLEKVNQDGMMVLNDFSFFHNYINDGVRSQKAELRSYYVFLLLQFSALFLFVISGLFLGFSIFQLLFFYFCYNLYFFG